MPTIVQVVCAVCGRRFDKQFNKYNETKKLGQDHCCSRSCVATKVNKLDDVREKRADFARTRTGASNPNWRGGITASESVMKSRAKNPERKKARDAVYRAIKKGTLVRPGKCERCGNPCFPSSHHEDYSKPLKVEFLCVTCHVEADRAVGKSG